MPGPVRFEKPFTQQEAIGDEAIAAALDVLHSGRLHRYNSVADELSPTSLLEQEYAAYQGADFCLAVASGGQALQIALRASGLQPGDRILANAYTLAPVPGAIHVAGGIPVFVEIDPDWTIDIDDLRDKASTSGAKFLLLSHMRGHIADMDPIVDICNALQITLIEDCAHTMGAQWNGVKSGNFGKVAGFSTQTYKHLNSGEGGLLTTNDPEIAARAVLLSGSYMLYERHGAAPPADVFEAVRLDTPNCSARMDNLRAAILRPQLSGLDENIRRWNERYRIIAAGVREGPGLHLRERPAEEAFVGSSIQFHASGLGPDGINQLVTTCRERGVELKWFGAAEPAGFTSRYDSWKYFGNVPELPKTLEILATTLDMRVPLTFSHNDCGLIGQIIAQAASELVRATR